MNKMQKAIVTLTKADIEWMSGVGIKESFRVARVDTRSCLNDLFGKGYSVNSVRHLIALRYADESEEDYEGSL